MKVSGGEFRSRELTVPRGIRPVSLRVKKSLFDILRSELEGSIVLDLFCGSGSLGIEALSLGAREAVFVDSGRDSIRAVSRNLAQLGLQSKSRVVCSDACAAISRLHAENRQFDLVFIDPPYSQGLSRKALQTINGYDIVSRRGVLVESCFYKDEIVLDYTLFSRVSSRQYGQTLITFYQKNDEESTVSRDI